MVNTPEVALKHSSRGGSHIPRKSYCRFEFQVCDWSLMKSSTGAQIVSQEFVMSDSSKWVLRIFPGGATPRQSGFVSVQMVLIELGNDEDCTTAYFTISIVGRKIMQEHLKMFTPLDNIFSLKSPSIMEFRLGDEAHSSWAVDNFILNSELEEKYMENDAVLFALEIEVLGKAELLSSTMPDSLGPMPSLSDDFGALLKSQEDTDITLVAGHKKIRCHRIVLAARSNYFKKKFQGTTFHTRLIFQGGQYYMQDISEEVLSEIVHFIYTDNYSENVLAVESRGLLAAAGRLELLRLFQICENYIGETLNPGNVVEALNTAAEVKSERLNTCCVEFISTHQSDVQATKTLGNLDSDALKDLIAKSILPATSVLLGGSETTWSGVPSQVPSPIKVDTTSSPGDTASASKQAVIDKAPQINEEVKDTESLSHADGGKPKSYADAVDVIPHAAVGRVI